jgi:hypothetical protein
MGEEGDGDVWWCVEKDVAEGLVLAKCIKRSGRR